MKVKTEEFDKQAVDALGDERSKSFLQFFTLVMKEMRNAAYGSFPDPDTAQDYGRSIRREAVNELPGLLELFEKKAVENGAKVFWAKDSHAANDYILQLARKKGVKYVTKGKSMITEELGLNDYLAANGVVPWETDLGELIIQLLGRPPFHLIGPAINIPVEEIRDLFMEKINMKTPTTDPAELGQAAREFLRDKFQHLEMGITGINMAVAETGTIINVENEGNIRFNKSAPPVQVSVMSLEKVVPTMADALYMLRLLCRSATGQPVGSYVTMDSGPKKKDEIDGPEELHIVILDNGRSGIYQDPISRESLRCIRCGACQNSCPIYRQIGGYPYGWVYAGPIGKILNPLLLGLDKTQHLFEACTLCGKCKEICPAGIDHPKLIRHFRQLQEHGRVDSALMKCYSAAANRPWLWQTGQNMVRSIRKTFSKQRKKIDD